MHRPVTWEGWQVWDLSTRLGGQVRAMPGVVIGFDMGAALALASALAIEGFAVAEFLPPIEAAMVRNMNKGRDDGG